MTTLPRWTIPIHVFLSVRTCLTVRFSAYRPQTLHVLRHTAMNKCVVYKFSFNRPLSSSCMFSCIARDRDPIAARLCHCRLTTAVLKADVTCHNSLGRLDVLLVPFKSDLMARRQLSQLRRCLFLLCRGQLLYFLAARRRNIPQTHVELN